MPAATTLTRPPTRTVPTRPTAKPQKIFTIESWHGEETGEKIIIYAESGMGKTTLASMAPDPVFIGLDDGGRKLHNPITGKELQHIPNVVDFDDVRKALSACLSLECKTIIVDTVTELEAWAERHVLKTVPGPRNSIVTSIKSYGYNDGYKYMYDAMRLILADCDRLIAAGKNVILISQLTTHKKATDTGEEFLKEGPQLYNGKPTIYGMVTQWSDYILRIDYQLEQVPDKKKRAVGDTTRIINTVAGLSYEAKARTSLDIPSIVSFSTKSDDSIWAFIFGDKP